MRGMLNREGREAEANPAKGIGMAFASFYASGMTTSTMVTLTTSRNSRRRERVSQGAVQTGKP